MEYIRQLSDEGEVPECFLCAYLARPEEDAQHHVLHRTDRCLVLMNRYPYTNGHLLVAPVVHEPDLSGLDEATLLEFTKLVRDWSRVAVETVHAHGLNVGMNLGRCAGAGLPGHVHMHIVPRWNGDTSFLSVISDTRVIPQDLDELYGAMRERARTLGFIR